MIGKGHLHFLLSLLQYLSLRSSEESQGALTRCCCSDPSPGDEFQNIENEIHQIVQHRVSSPGAQTEIIPLLNLLHLQLVAWGV